MTVRFNTSLCDIIANVIGTTTFPVANAATLYVYTGTQPALATDAATGTLLVSIPLAIGFLTSAGGVAALNTGSASSGTAGATGTPGWARLKNTADNRIDGSVGMTGADFTINAATITSGATITLTACNITQPAS